MNILFSRLYRQYTGSSDDFVEVTWASDQTRHLSSVQGIVIVYRQGSGRFWSSRDQPMCSILDRIWADIYRSIFDGFIGGVETRACDDRPADHDDKDHRWVGRSPEAHAPRHRVSERTSSISCQDDCQRKSSERHAQVGYYRVRGCCRKRCSRPAG